MKKVTIPLVLALSLSACTSILFPYEKPAEPTPDAFREVGKGDDAWPDAEWWKQFNTPELTSLVEASLAHNNDLGAAVARLHQADAEVSINGAALLPSVDATAGATHTHSKSNGATTTTTAVATRGRSGTAYNAGLTASYELDFWGKNYSALQSAEASRDSAAFDMQVVRLTVTSSVATIYFDLLATDERRAIAQQSLNDAQSVLDSLRKQFAHGIVSGLDVAQQESLLATQNAVLAPLDLERSKDLDALAILLGQLPESVKAPSTKLNSVVIPTVPAGLASTLLTRRPDVAEAEANLQAAHANINSARAAFFPDITLTAQGGYSSNALHSLIEPGGLLVSFGANLVQPIFEGGLLTGQLELSKAQYEELAQNYHKAVISAFADTEDSLAAVKQTAAQEVAQAEVVRASNEAYQLSQRQFKGGIVDITTVLNTERTLFSARDGLAAARLQHLQAIAGLYKSLGGGWQQAATPSH